MTIILRFKFINANDWFCRQSYTVVTSVGTGSTKLLLTLLSITNSLYFVADDDNDKFICYSDRASDYSAKIVAND